ncbi:MAG: arginine repressor [Clostridia bacterium]|nr:arginine repressor [Clostridia bacterium]
MSKKLRHKKILEIIEQMSIQTQGQLTDCLIDAGFDVTQATVSRDIKELRLVKIAGKGEEYKYALPGRENDADRSKRYIALLSHSLINVQCAGNLVVLKSIPGSASGCAIAVEILDFKEIVGILAGDDTVFLAVTTPKAAEEIAEKIGEVTE